MFTLAGFVCGALIVTIRMFQVDYRRLTSRYAGDKNIDLLLTVLWVSLFLMFAVLSGAEAYKW